jgi:hypothetical protein
MDVAAVRRPRFKSSFRPIISADEGLCLFSESRQAWLPDPLYAALARMLDGTNDVKAIFASLSTSDPAEQVFAALDHLKSSGYLAEDAAAEARQTAASWEHLDVFPPLARAFRRRLRRSRSLRRRRSRIARGLPSLAGRQRRPRGRGFLARPLGESELNPFSVEM